MSSPSIDKIIVTPYRLGLRRALRWSTGELGAVEHMLVEVVLSDGATGWAEAIPRPTIHGETLRSMLAIIDEWLVPRMLGRPATLPLDFGGLVGNNAAKGALDIALDQALVQSSGHSVLDAGEPAVERLRAAYILGLDDLDATLQEAQDVWQAGVRVFKVKGERDWQRTITLLEALRNQFGDACVDYVDFNQALPVADSLACAETLAALGVTHAEEPLPIEQIAARRAWCEQAEVALVADDSALTLKDLTRETGLGTYDCVNLKPARLGYWQGLQMAKQAQAAGKGVIVGSQAGSGAGVIQAVRFASRVAPEGPCELTGHLRLCPDVLAEPPKLVDGWLRPDEVERLVLDRAVIAHHQIDRPMSWTHGKR